MVEESGISIEKEPARVPASRIIQPGAETKVEATGQFVEAAMTPISYAGPSFPSAPYSTETKPLIIDIETSGSKPWNSELICIGYIDPLNASTGAKVIIGKTEPEMLIDFLDVYTRGGYDELIGYNVAFDYRFIFSRMLYYRISSQEFVNAKLYDIMQVMQQVKQEFVYGYNKSGKLNDWTTYLLGMSKPLTFEEMLILWKSKDLDAIEAYNANDIMMEYFLYSLLQITIRTPYSGVSFASPPLKKAEREINAELIPSSLPTSVIQTGPTYTAKCPVCLSETEVSEKQEPSICPICGSQMIKKEEE